MKTPTRKIPLTQGFVALVDADDAPLVRQYSWYAAVKSGCVYAVTRLKSTRKDIPMHRLITGAPAGCNVRFQNRNTLDNRRKNLVVPRAPKVA